MPTPLDVENQRFVFGDRWTVAFKYDDIEFYRKEAIKLQGEVDGLAQSAKAVDVVGLHQHTGLLLLEVKDFRGHRIANKGRLGDELATEVAAKARDTVAALVGAARKPVSEFPSETLMAALGKNKPLSIILWLEDDTFRNTENAKVSLGVLNQKLKTKLSWLNARTLALSSSVPMNRLDELTVTNLPGAGQPNP